ncbi:MAG: FAD-binding oxidoreductase [Alphaproteobacteria bacterium]|nr:FAD-binding oxidoreductase [Alphaproteobacteria bacterium]
MTADPTSHWGWGRADRFPDLDTRTALAGQLQAVLGIPGLPPEAPVALADVTLPASRLAVPAGLAAFTTDDREARVRHTYGRSYPDLVRGFRGDFASAPDLVARPRTEDEVVAAVRWASDHDVAVIPYGGGTSVVGGVEPVVGPRYAGTLTVDLRALDRVLEVDPVSRLARIQAGATGPVLEQQLAAHGLTLRHFPQSFEYATLGGWIATRAGGHFATLTTHIDDLVASLRVVAPTGVAQTRRLPASGAGPAPDRLWIGSEGTLGLITEAWMRVRPRPRWRSSASARFTAWSAAVAAVRALAQSGLHPANCRLLDRREALLHGVSFDGTDVLLLGFESADHPTEAAMARALAIVADHGGACPDGTTHRDDGAAAGHDGQAGTWRQAFFDGPYLQTAMVSMGVIVDTFETAVTWDRFDALHAGVVRAVRDAIVAVTGQKGFVSCRFTHVYPDGPAPYYTFVAAGARGEEIARWQAIKAAASDALIALGATITHHHAVGRRHQPWYRQERPELFARALAGARRSLDPKGVLNPGVLLADDEA